MNRCALYVRKSTAQDGVADEATSIARQVEHATAFALTQGWSVAPEHVFVDDGVSGALFGDQRPGLARLLNALRPRPPFQALVASEVARYGRESIETAWAMKQITDSGVRIFDYLDGKEWKLDNAMDKIQLSLANFASEVERERASVRTHDALLRKAKAGAVCGGLIFGYINCAILDEAGRRHHVERIIEPREAAVVKQIFTHAAAGWGVKRIAAALNDAGAPAPLPRRAGRPRGWAPSSVREILGRDIYRGVVVWNRTARIVRQGARAQRKRPPSDIVRVNVPELAIVDEGLWTATQARRQQAATVYRQRTDGRAFGRPANGVESPYLLTGTGTCICGGSMAVLKRPRSTWTPATDPVLRLHDAPSSRRPDLPQCAPGPARQRGRGGPRRRRA
jgi:site-specific DNA recombinase